MIHSKEAVPRIRCPGDGAGDGDDGAQNLPCFRLHVEHLSNCSFKSRYVGPRVPERFDAVPTDVVEGEVQEHWWFASNGAKRFSPPSRMRLVGIETPSFLVGPALP